MKLGYLMIDEKDMNYQAIINLASKGLTYSQTVRDSQFDANVLLLSEKEMPKQEAEWLIAAYHEAKYDYSETRYENMDDWDVVEEGDWWGVAHKKQNKNSLTITLANGRNYEFVEDGNTTIIQ